MAIIRPSLLVGNRKSFRLGEVIFTPVMNTLSIFAFGSLKKYKPIKIENVVKAILYIAKNEIHKTIKVLNIIIKSKKAVFSSYLSFIYGHKTNLENILRLDI